MSIKRIWFINNPSPGLGSDDRSQIAIGYPLWVDVPYVYSTDRYLRRYLQDPIQLTDVGPLVETPIIPETELTKYLRRYLVDPVQLISVGPSIESPVIPETGFTRYLRRYLVDPKT